VLLSHEPTIAVQRSSSTFSTAARNSYAAPPGVNSYADHRRQRRSGDDLLRSRRRLQPAAHRALPRLVWAGSAQPLVVLTRRSLRSSFRNDLRCRNALPRARQ
jgi:hypothetical protein